VPAWSYEFVRLCTKAPYHHTHATFFKYSNQALWYYQFLEWIINKQSLTMPKSRKLVHSCYYKIQTKSIWTNLPAEIIMTRLKNLPRPHCIHPLNHSRHVGGSSGGLGGAGFSWSTTGLSSLRPCEITTLTGMWSLDTAAEHDGSRTLSAECISWERLIVSRLFPFGIRIDFSLKPDQMHYGYSL